MIYHTTFHLDDAVRDDALRYLKRRCIPNAIQSGLPDRPALHRRMQCEGAELQRDLTATFGAKIAGCSTLLEEMELE
jgi:hypothetical protein